MNEKTPKLLVLVGLASICILLSGCVTGGQDSSATPSATAIHTLPDMMPTQMPDGNNPASNPGSTPPVTSVPTTPPGTPSPIDTPGSPGGNQTNPSPGAPTPTPTADPSPSTTPQPALSGQTSGWGTDKSTYNRGDTMTGWVDVTNTGNVPITEIVFVITMKRTDLPVSKTSNYSSQGLNIQPGQTQRITFSEIIPETYNWFSTAGNYQLTAIAKLAGQEIGSYSKYITIQ